MERTLRLLVSNADDVGIIHKRIIQNLYDNPVVVCDVSGKNPNVMFELGLRLAFDKPTIIVKDDKTAYSFDTSAIEHLEYPRDLRFSRIVEFKKKLSEKIKATHAKATSDSDYTTFLKHFGEFKVAKIDEKEVSGQEFILEELRALRYAMRRFEQGSKERLNFHSRLTVTKNGIDFCMDDRSNAEVLELFKAVSTYPGVVAATREDRNGHSHIFVELKSDADLAELERFIGAGRLVGRKAYNGKRISKASESA